ELAGSIALGGNVALFAIVHPLLAVDPRLASRRLDPFDRDLAVRVHRLAGGAERHGLEAFLLGLVPARLRGDVLARGHVTVRVDAEDTRGAREVDVRAAA